MVGSRRGCKLGVQGAAERAERLETTAVGAPPLLTGVLVIVRPGSSGHGAGHCWPQDTALPWISPKCLSPARLGPFPSQAAEGLPCLRAMLTTAGPLGECRFSLPIKPKEARPARLGG